MIEQTELVVTEWHYYEPAIIAEKETKVSQLISLDVMKKRAPTKKGIACKFTCRFFSEDETILEYVGEDSYVIDFEEVIDKHELLKMIRNSYSKFKEKFDLRKMGTALQNRSLKALDETSMDVDAILPLLI